MVVSTFSVLDKDGKERFFEESFLLANVKSDVVFGIPILTMSNIDVDFQVCDLQWRSYTTGNIFPTIRQVKLIEIEELITTALDLGYKAIMVYIVALCVNSGDKVHPSKKAHIAHLKADEAPTKVASKYTDFVDIFSLKLAMKLPKHTRIHNHTIELVDDSQPPYGLIYSLGLVELEILKVYIKNNVAHGFIRPFKFPARPPIFFDKKPDGNLRLCMDY